jgi:hypothetical protein
LYKYTPRIISAVCTKSLTDLVYWSSFRIYRFTKNNNFSLSCSHCPVLAVLFLLSWLPSTFCSAFAVLFSQFCGGRPILAALSWRPVLAILSWPSCPGHPVLELLSWQSCSDHPALPVPFWLYRSGCPVQAVLFLVILVSWQSCPGSPVLAAVLFWHQSCPYERKEVGSAKVNQKRERKL